MRCSLLVLVAVICVAAVTAKKTQTEKIPVTSEDSLVVASAGKPVKCGLWEVAVNGKPRKDNFCKPHLTRPSVVKKLRRCICQSGYVRNSWNKCILKKYCDMCKGRPKTDYNTCESACPLKCGQPVTSWCTAQCVGKCSCPPGYIVHRKRNETCVAARKCPPKCPRYSRFQLCVSTCQHWCGRPRPKKCATECHSGDCVCNRGFAKTWENGEIKCVKKKKCPKQIKATTKKQ